MCTHWGTARARHRAPGRAAQKKLTVMPMLWEPLHSVRHQR
jgi:hypothetical protein